MEPIIEFKDYSFKYRAQKEPTLKKPKGSRRKRKRTGGSFKRTKVRAEKSAKR